MIVDLCRISCTQWSSPHLLRCMLVNAVATKNGMLTVHLIRHGLMWSSTSAVRLTGWVCRVHNSRKFTSRPVNESDLVHSISGEIRRKQTAAQLLRLIAGRPLEDKQRVRTTFQQLATPEQNTTSSEVLLYRKSNCLLLYIFFLQHPYQRAG